MWQHAYHYCLYITLFGDRFCSSQMVNWKVNRCHNFFWMQLGLIFKRCLFFFLGLKIYIYFNSEKCNILLWLHPNYLSFLLIFRISSTEIRLNLSFFILWNHGFLDTEKPKVSIGEYDVMFNTFAFIKLSHSNRIV